jgi:L-2-hydroxyglutarate oxidase LhgO
MSSQARVPIPYFAKGSYFRYSDASIQLDQLVYPLPSKGGLGVHTTVDMSGVLKFGPNVDWFPQPLEQILNQGDRSDRENQDLSRYYLPPTITHPGAYTVNDSVSLQRSFHDEIHQYLPQVRYECLVPDYAGIRPKLVGPSHFGKLSKGQITPTDIFARDLSDFIIEGPNEHRIPGLVNLFGIESPGLTASLSIADRVKYLLNVQR